MHQLDNRTFLSKSVVLLFGFPLSVHLNHSALKDAFGQVVVYRATNSTCEPWLTKSVFNAHRHPVLFLSLSTPPPFLEYAIKHTHASLQTTRVQMTIDPTLENAFKKAFDSSACTSEYVDLIIMFLVSFT